MKKRELLTRKQDEIVNKISEVVKKEFENEGSGHDWWHIFRVWNNSVLIGKKEKADMYVVQLSALLHDIRDYKFHGGDFSLGGKVAKEYLQEYSVDKETISNVCEIVDTISFKGAGAEKPMRTLEGEVVRDSDRLDAIGAIGIARCFAYGGHKGFPIHIPDIKPELHKNKEEYLSRQSSQINHFHEKLLLLKDLMLTETGRILAGKRHEFMEKYLEQFYREWDGKA